MKLRIIIPFVITSGFLLFYVVYKRIKRNKTDFYTRLKKQRDGITTFSLRDVCARTNTSIEGYLVHILPKTIIPYQFRIDFLTNNTIKILINDNTRRYSIEKSIINQSHSNKICNNLNLTSYDSYYLIIHDQHRIELQKEPFDIRIYRNNLLIAHINQQHFLQFESNEPEMQGVSIDIYLPSAIKVYGLPLRPTHFTLNRTTHSQPYRLYNSDHFAYRCGNQPLYGSVPVLYTHSSSQTSVGIIWLNASETFIDLDDDNHGLSVIFSSESGRMEFVLLTGPQLSDCIKQNAQLTGVVPLPSIFALGYHQCRYSYKTQQEVVDVCQKLDNGRFPYDSIWLDIDYTDGKRYFTWNRTNFPTPQQLVDFLKNSNRKLITIIDPHIKVDRNYTIYQTCREFFVKTHNSNVEYQDNCWPGLSCWLDFFNKDARNYYTTLLQHFLIDDNHHIWIDMNEPSVFNRIGTLPKNVRHSDGWLHRDLHNLYGHYHALSTYQALKSRNIRPFILTRSHFIGTQQFATIWTGDNRANFEHLAITIPMCLSASICGFSACGSDVGGFVGEPTVELLIRWYQLGAWLPFFREHSNIDTNYREPYRFNEPTQTRIRSAINQRYHHLLYWYTVFYQHSIDYEPVLRPLVYQYPNDERVFDIDDEFLIGSDILISPVLNEGIENINIYLPNDDIWYLIGDDPPFLSSIYSGDLFRLSVSLDRIPVFYRGGSIVPIFGEIGRNTKETLEKSLNLYVFLNTTAANTACGCLYKDDGETFNYQQNEFLYTQIEFKHNSLINCVLNGNYHQLVSSIFIYSRSELFIRKAVINNEIVLRFRQFGNCTEIYDVNIELSKNFVIDLLE